MKLEKTINKNLDYKIKEAIDIYYLAYSGGKDSDVLLHIARRSGVNFQAVHNFTSISHKEQRKHVKEQKGVKIIQPKKTFYKLVEEKGLPTRFRRWCCGVLKHDYGKGKITMTGVRKSESVARAKRAKEHTEFGAKGINKKIRSVLPLLNFTDSDIYAYIDLHNIKLCKLYSMGYKRVGCVGCPLANLKQRRNDFSHSPNIKKAIERSFEKYMNKNKTEGHKRVKETFKTGKNGVDWWLSGLSIKQWQFEQSKKSLF